MIFTPVILAGGFGTRLWPVSRTSLPKQFSSFFGEYSLFQQTILRVSNSEIFCDPIIICNNEHRFLALSQLHALKISKFTILLETSSRSTGPAIAVASHYVNNHQDLYSPNLIILSSDHLISDQINFEKSVNLSKNYLDDFFVTFGFKPTSPSSDFGYINYGDEIVEKSGVFYIQKFIEKPNLNVAKDLIANGNILWNCGFFAINSKLYLHKILDLNSDLHTNSYKSLEDSKKDYEFILLNQEYFEKCPDISIDYLVLEKVKNIAVIPLNCSWDDLGTWQSIYQNSPKDSDGNSFNGNIISLNSKSCYIYSPNQLIATYNLENLFVISTDDATLIINRQDLSQIKNLYKKISELQPEICHKTDKSIRPWGSFQIINIGKNYKVKKIVVNPNSSISLQK
ncbi:MAG: mannose-1-phosphate guanylyltransferase/mannose-6-phosphate isomerase, partial [Rickettsiales bacterium]